ncbi:pyridoxal-phosphate dependent enzyme [Streptomyces sp. NPDC003007]
METLNPLRSFKGRGADLCMRRLTAGQHVVCASAGNFGQVMAYAGKARSIPVMVFAAHDANPNKVARMRNLGAEVVLAGGDFDAAKDAARPSRAPARNTSSWRTETSRSSPRAPAPSPSNWPRSAWTRSSSRSATAP